MARTVAIGKQNFGDMVEKDYFYVDKTDFIAEWWENGDDVTLITRPRRFGKTLTMSMMEHFFLSDMREEVICLSILVSGKKKRTENCREVIL